MSLTDRRNRPPVSKRQRKTSRARYRLTTKHHLDILLLARTGQAVSPEQVQSLPPMKIKELLY